MAVLLRVKLDHSIQSETIKSLEGILYHSQISKDLRKVLSNQWQTLTKLEQQQIAINELKEVVMGIKEDFAEFTAAVNERTNEIATAMTEIREDIERLIVASTTTPPEILAGMEEVKAKLYVLAETSKAIAAMDSPVVPPPLEGPTQPEEPL